MASLPWLPITELNSKTSAWPPRLLCDLPITPSLPAPTSSPTTLPPPESILFSCLGRPHLRRPHLRLRSYYCLSLKLPCVLQVAPSRPDLCLIHHHNKEALPTSLPKRACSCPSLPSSHVLFVFTAQNFVYILF